MTPVKVPTIRLMQHRWELGRWWRHRIMTDSRLKTRSDAGQPSIASTTSRHSPQLDQQNLRAADTPDEQKAPGALRSRWRRPLLIMGPVALIVGALGLYLTTGRYVTEEDAYVQAINVSISPQVAGQVVAIAARSNTAVKGRPTVQH